MLKTLTFTRTEEISIDLPIAGPVHPRDAEAFANEEAGDMTRLEAHAIAKNSTAIVKASPWTLTAAEGEAIVNPFALIPQPPKPRGRRPGSTAGAGTAEPGAGDPPGSGQDTD